MIGPSTNNRIILLYYNILEAPFTILRNRANTTKLRWKSKGNAADMIVSSRRSTCHAWVWSWEWAVDSDIMALVAETKQRTIANRVHISGVSWFMVRLETSHVELGLHEMSLPECPQFSVSLISRCGSCKTTCQTLWVSWSQWRPVDSFSSLIRTCSAYWRLPCSVPLHLWLFGSHWHSLPCRVERPGA